MVVNDVDQEPVPTITLPGECVPPSSPPQTPPIREAPAQLLCVGQTVVFDLCGKRGFIKDVRL